LEDALQLLVVKPVLLDNLTRALIFVDALIKIKQEGNLFEYADPGEGKSNY